MQAHNRVIVQTSAVGIVERHQRVEGFSLVFLQGHQHPPAQRLAQTLRCYTPADFILLAEGAGLRVEHIEVKGQALDLTPDEITLDETLLEEYCFLARLCRCV